MTKQEFYIQLDILGESAIKFLSPPGPLFLHYCFFLSALSVVFCNSQGNGRTNKPKVIDAESFVPFVSQNRLGWKSSLRSSSPTFTSLLKAQRMFLFWKMSIPQKWRYTENLSIFGSSHYFVSYFARGRQPGAAGQGSGRTQKTSEKQEMWGNSKQVFNLDHLLFSFINSTSAGYPSLSLWH